MLLSMSDYICIGIIFGPIHFALIYFVYKLYCFENIIHKIIKSKKMEPLFDLIDILLKHTSITKEKYLILINNSINSVPSIINEILNTNISETHIDNINDIKYNIKLKKIKRDFIDYSYHLLYQNSK